MSTWCIDRLEKPTKSEVVKAKEAIVNSVVACIRITGSQLSKSQNQLAKLRAQ